MDCHAANAARNDGVRALCEKVDSRIKLVLGLNDSKHCGGAVRALQKLGKVSDLSGRAFHKTSEALAVGDVSLVIFATLPHCLPKTESLVVRSFSYLHHLVSPWQSLTHLVRFVS